MKMHKPDLEAQFVCYRGVCLAQDNNFPTFGYNMQVTPHTEELYIEYKKLLRTVSIHVLNTHKTKHCSRKAKHAMTQRC